jgi:hypothetical protein
VYTEKIPKQFKNTKRNITKLEQFPTQSLYHLDFTTFQQSTIHTHNTTTAPTPSPQQAHTDPIPKLTLNEITFLKKQETQGKISLHQNPFINSSQYEHEALGSDTFPFRMPENPCTYELRYVFTQWFTAPNTLPKPSPQQPNTTTSPKPTRTKPYLASACVVGLDESIKHSLHSHISKTLYDTYWKAERWKLRLLVQNSLLISLSNQFTLNTTYTPSTKQRPPDLAHPYGLPIFGIAQQKCSVGPIR